MVTRINQNSTPKQSSGNAMFERPDRADSSWYRFGRCPRLLNASSYHPHHSHNRNLHGLPRDLPSSPVPPPYPHVVIVIINISIAIAFILTIMITTTTRTRALQALFVCDQGNHRVQAGRS